MPKIRYNNMNDASTDHSVQEFRQWRKERKGKKKDLSFRVPNVPPDIEYLHANRRDATITWIGHSTFLIQYEGLNLVTDPVWAKRMGLDPRLGEPGIAIGDMPPVDVVLISHSHYDHLHLASIRKLYREETTVIVPAGLRAKMVGKGFSNSIELNWWEEAVIGGAKITFVPAQHWTRRTPFDTNTSHWGGYVLEPAGHAQFRDGEEPVKGEEPALYFAGDSGYFPGFKEIGSRFDIDVAMIPIGAYEPEWFMATQHVNPEQALQAFLDVRADKMIPMHYGTFRLADDTPREALDRMEAERVRLGIKAERIQVLKHGETLRVNKSSFT
ncbi:MBL fold metallo-hydrolase [Paenibacillus sp. VCA1]|uniref:MBL fold metallo-hydrolase n=1 Tax=Paenibacillus sp. VCA1 TaxID=3039148 RepID=UPI00287138DD|nr:MBL fold metallo-hydrolase [Paenibacillus sp. VCA1]MDR9857068.1 MBL fold metallo-hydrolase [Paenibacillus sp. VCA1]